MTFRPEPPGARRPADAVPAPADDEATATTTAEPAEVAAVSVPTPYADAPTAETTTAPGPAGTAVALPLPTIQGSAFRQRYGVFYDTQGPKVRVGFLWAVAVVASLAIRNLRPFGLAVLFALVAGAAAAQILDAHRGRDTTTDRRVASIGASALPILATIGARGLGVGILGLVVAAVLAALVVPDPDHHAVLGRAGHVVAASVLCGGAAAALVLLADYEIGAVIILLTFVLVYDASDYIVGSGATNGIEGPLAGILFIAATTALFAVVKAPPFHGTDIWSFSVLAMLACPAGQLLASALLPQASARAPALRRLDSLLVAAPAWAGLVGLYLLHVS